MDSGECKEVSTSHLQGDDIARQNVRVVVTCISKEMPLSAAEWTLENLLTAGDLLILLIIYEDTSHQPLAQSCDRNETDGEVFPDEASRLKPEIENTMAMFQSSCKEKGVSFEIRVKAGDVKSVIVEEVNAVHASSVTLDRNLKLKEGEDVKLIQDNCKIYFMSNGDEVDSMHEAVNTEEKSFSDEEAEATSMSLESDLFSMNLEDSSSQAVSSVPGSIDYQQFSAAHADAYSTSGYLQRHFSFLYSSAVDSPISTPMGTASHTRSSTSGNSYSLTGRASILSTSTSSSSSTPTNIRKSKPNWDVPCNTFPQGGRSLLCSVCKQMSPIFRNIPRRFSFTELEAATDNFSKSNFLAEGGFGFVYKGMLNGQYIAVKQHKLVSAQGYKEFRSEVELLSCAQHRNLVMLLGCCDENGHRMLVYEYVCNKSLDWHLSPTKNPKCLEWAARQKIAVGSARAMRYLHEECRVGCIVHRDMRPNNILLTHDFEPMVGDFGLARSHSEGEDAIETRIIGTFGYLAPEYAESGQVSWKADVYAFGVVLLELITGRKAIDLLRPPGQQSLAEWARPRLLNDAMFADLVDARLGKSYIRSEVRAMMRAAYHCIAKDPRQRPRMSQVLHVLEGENKGSDEIPKRPVDLYSNIQPATASLSMSSLKSQIRREQTGSSGSRKPRLLYENML